MLVWQLQEIARSGRRLRGMVIVAVRVRQMMPSIVFQLVLAILLKCRIEVFLLIGSELRLDK